MSEIVEEIVGTNDIEVNYVEVYTVLDHAGADKLEIVRVKDADVGILKYGYTIIGGLDQYAIGDKAFLFPPDSVFPEELVKALDLKYLHKDVRVKETKLRGVVSQALILPEGLLFKQFPEYFREHKAISSVNYAPIFGITKYEPPITFQRGDTLSLLPEGVKKYDIDNAERRGDIFWELVDQRVVITEKLEGTNLSVHLDVDGEVFVCSRRLAVKDGDNVYWNAARDANLVENAKIIQRQFPYVDTVTIRGEIIGSSIQGNIYKYDNAREAVVFDIQLNGHYVSYPLFAFLCKTLEMRPAPIVYSGILSDYANTVESLKDRSDGMSILSGTRREGVVIRPVMEGTVFGDDSRLQLKQRSPEYLAQ